ncbi:MAG: HAMP domain-containing sensor histidine kinase [Syntrophaceae bacterium]
MTIEYIYPFFILTGLVIIGVLIYIRYLTRKAIRSLLECIDLNTKLDYDLHRFLPDVIPLLKKINVDDLFYTIHYLNTTLVKENTANRSPIEKTLERGDYRISMGIVPRHSRGEQYYMNMIVLEILAHVIEMDVLIKIKVIHEAFYKFSQLQTFILHDTKNLAQFIEFLSYNVLHLETPDRQERFISYLKETLPAQSRRGAKIISLLEMKKETDTGKSDKSTINLKSLLEDMANHYHLNYTINGEGSITAEEYKINSIFINLLKNVYDKSLEERDLTCHIDIISDGNNVKVVIADSGSPIKDSARIFEPFYSTKPGRGGLGVGLFQAQNIARAMNGDIKVLPQAIGAAFEITFPLQQNM